MPLPLPYSTRVCQISRSLSLIKLTLVVEEKLRPELLVTFASIGKSVCSMRMFGFCGVSIILIVLVAVLLRVQFPRLKIESQKHSTPLLENPCTVLLPQFRWRLSVPAMNPLEKLKLVGSWK